METNGFRAPIRASVGTFPGIERKTPPQIALCRPFATRTMAESAEGSCAVIVSESACRPRAGTGVHEKRRRGFDSASMFLENYSIRGQGIIERRT